MANEEVGEEECFNEEDYYDRLMADELPKTGEYRSEWLKTAGMGTLAVVSVLANAFAINTVHDIVGRQALADVVFEMVPQQRWAWQAADGLLALTGVLTVVCVALNPLRAIVLRRFCLLATLLYLMRAICIAATPLPTSFADGHTTCAPPLVNATLADVLDRFLVYVVGFGLKHGDGVVCGDLVYSGHTTVFALCCFTLNRYTPRSMWPLRCGSFVAFAFGAVFMVLSRSHYSIDVLLAYWLTTGSFTLYHAFCDVPHLERRRSAFRRLWIFWLLSALEEHVPAGALPNELAWPLERPACLARLCRQWSDNDPNTPVGRFSNNMASIARRARI